MADNNQATDPQNTQDALLERIAKLEEMVLNLVAHFSQKTDATNGSVMELKNTLNLWSPIFQGMAARIKAIEDRLGGDSTSGSQEAAQDPNPNPKTPPSNLSGSQSPEEVVDYQPRSMGKIEQAIARTRANAFPHLNRPTLSRGSSPEQ